MVLRNRQRRGGNPGLRVASHPAWRGIDLIEGEIDEAIAAIRGNQLELAVRILEGARQEIGESLREELGIYEWNREEE